jgi:CRISPR/Cas system-associated exonuclease Cas4 (RecB family)
LSSKWILSATEIDTFETCRRKWAYQYVDAIKTPPSKAAEFGLLVHEWLQKHLTGESINHQTPEGRVATPGLHYLPKQLPKENVERPIFFMKDGNIFHGYIDFFEQVGCQTWLIGDHKTSSNLSKIPTPDELKKNIQANMYAQWAFTEKAADSIKLKWIYYRSQSTPKALCVETEISREEGEKNFEAITKIAKEILTIVRDKSPSSAQPKNLNACFKYGRCAFYSQCKNSLVTAALVEHPCSTKINEADLSSSCHNKANSFHLYIDCMPVKNASNYEHTIELSELLKPVLSKIQTEKELSHYRLAGYGLHVGIIANYLSEHLKNKAYDNRTAILSSSKTPEGCDTLQTLTAAAGQVVRGF